VSDGDDVASKSWAGRPERTRGSWRLAPLLTDEDALRVVRPNVTVWIDKLRHAGHVICVRKRRGANPNAGFRIEVDGRVMKFGSCGAGKIALIEQRELEN
jgi:hypothetical protein